ncbi:MAG: TonB-dependent receptor [Melioribacteraceae bacterium]|nr:TonB-dependent receptor [Melioribacteraceae bacterium]
MRSILYAFFILIIFSLCSYAQSALIKGTVQDEKGSPLQYANVYLEEAGLGTSVKEDGTFIIENIQPGSYTLRVTMVGYKSYSQVVSIKKDEQLSFNITLEEKSFEMPQIELIGKRPQRLDRVPGSATVIKQQQIIDIAPISGNEVFRKITGVHALEEDNVGLRANIGIRGLDPSRSRSVLMLEDGVPVALAPYGEPEMYYTPAMDRMAGVELVKGSGSILFGPQTFGGVLNYLTPDPPALPTTSLQLRGGEGGFFTGQLGYGTTLGNTGFNVTYLRKQGNQVGLLNYRINDLTSKIKLMLSENSSLGLKFGVYDETSNSTYVGLSQPMYESGSYDFTHLSPNDKLDIRRYSASITHNLFINDNVTLRTTAFGYTTTRNWSRQDFDNSSNPERDYVRIVGNPDVEGGAIYFRDGTGNRDRSFEVLGIEPRLSLNYNIGNISNELDLGVRYLYERAFEQRVNGNVLSPASGELRNDEIRTGRAFSSYIQNAFNLTESFSVTPGVRFEYFEYTRDIKRLNNENVEIKNTDEVTEVIPGIGLNYRIQPGIVFFGGVHRGYGPPRIKDAISAEGVSEELDAEKSWNYELGTRANLLSGLDFELTGFYMDFSNQIIPVSESAGGTGRPGASLTNGGATKHLGVEAGISLDLRKMIKTDYGIIFNTNATFINAEFSEDRFVKDGDKTVNINGNKVPYSPEILISSGVSIATPINIGLSLTGTYIGKQYGDPLNRETGTLNGREGPVGAHFVVDARISYKIPQLQNLVLSLSVKNLFDERYIVSRRPQGIRVGLPRFITMGLDLEI